MFTLISPLLKRPTSEALNGIPKCFAISVAKPRVPFPANSLRRLPPIGITAPPNRDHCRPCFFDAFVPSLLYFPDASGQYLGCLSVRRDSKLNRLQYKPPRQSAAAQLNLRCNQ